MVVHAARTPAEVMLAAPLLKHSSVLDLRLHYTGNSKALMATQQTLPAALPSAAASFSNNLSSSGAAPHRFHVLMCAILAPLMWVLMWISSGFKLECAFGGFPLHLPIRL